MKIKTNFVVSRRRERLSPFSKDYESRFISSLERNKRKYKEKTA